ncbi:MAG TPA: hypothetical protein GXX25_13790 [Desulfotomaculum sp.]|nr:hypothetical protein [Desulfotomaculum sp.]
MLPKRKMDNYEKDLVKARILSERIAKKMRAAGITQEQVEKDVHEAFREIKRNRRSNRN